MFRASGGALYHWRAWHRRRHWREFRAQIASWLAGWTTSKHALVLVGPSAGYTLPTDWLKTFGRVDAYDLDPLAPPLFRLRHRGVRVRFHRRDIFWREDRLSLSGVRSVLDAHPSAVILFSNVLGQVLLEGTATEAEWETYLRELRTALHGREWASYHDVFTHEPGQIIDHLTRGAWSHGLPRRAFEWPLTAQSRHEIEGLTSANQVE